MEYRKLGNTNLNVSVVAMGCWPIVGGFNWGEQDEADSVATIQAALDQGINFFDTAEMYGEGKSEQLLAKVLPQRRGKVVIASKFAPQNSAPDDLREACHRSLKHLNTDYIDLYQVHWPRHDMPFEPVARTLEQLRQEGKIRAIGVCNFAVQDLGDWLSMAPCLTNQLPYNLLFRAVEFAVQPLCVRHNIGILSYSSLLMGLLTGKFTSADQVRADRARTRHFSGKREFARHGEPGHEELTFATLAKIRALCDGIGHPMADVALAWLLRQPGVTSVLAGARTPAQVTENVRAATLRLSDATVSRLTDATAALKQALGPNPDLWQSQSRMR